jgi:diadenosine tetraphosphate (Ap4A) HIT family hydrolase
MPTPGCNSLTRTRRCPLVPTIFSRIIAGEIPARFVWRDERAVAFLDVRPLAPGHVLVVPVDEIDQWTDLAADTAAHLMTVAHAVGNAQMQAFSPPRIGLMIAGFEVPHVHIHVMPVHSMQQFDFSRADTSPDPARLDRDADELRAALRADGHSSVA